MDESIRNRVTLSIVDSTGNRCFSDSTQVESAGAVRSQVKIERIVSRGHASPEGFWYNQEKNEFVLVLQGSAGLKIQGDDHLAVLKRGDYLTIDAHVKHRVEWTDPDCETVWLAVHY